MKAQLVTCLGEKIVSVRNIELPENYDGNPYGETIPFPVHSNQFIRTDADEFTSEFDLTPDNS